MGIFDNLFNNDVLYFTVLDQVSEAIYVENAEKRQVFCNKAAEELDGYKNSEVKGMLATDIYKGIDETTSPALRALVTEAPVCNEVFRYFVNGKEVIQLCNAFPIYEDGKLVGSYTVQKDLTSIKDILEKNIQLQKELSIYQNTQKTDKNKGQSFQNIVGKDSTFLQSKNLAVQATKTDSTVMLMGQTGTGKDVFARAIHDNSERSKKSFIAINCAAIPEGLIESLLFGTTKGVYTGAIDKDGIFTQAEGGTVFLDELNSMPLSAQAKLLRVLEEKKIMKLGSSKETPIDVRIISSINEDPTELIEKNVLRKDLYYRLAVIQIMIPPLSQRVADIPLLVDYFIAKFNKKLNKNIIGVDEEVIKYFLSYAWPGNVRQLRTSLESAMNIIDDGCSISMDSLPHHLFENSLNPEERYNKSTHSLLTDDDSLKKEPVLHQKDVMDKIYQKQVEVLVDALTKAEGNVAKAARTIGISRQLFAYRLKKYGILK